MGVGGDFIDVKLAFHVIPTDEGGSVSMGGGLKRTILYGTVFEAIDTLGFASV